MVNSDHQIIQGDCLEVMAGMEAGSVNCVVTSPPYWGLRDYGVDGQLGLEATPEEYVAKMVDVFRAVRRVLRDDGTVWLVIGDSYAQAAGSCPQGDSQCWRPSNDVKHSRARKSQMGGRLKPKDLVGIPWRVAFALQADGWWLRQDIIWHKPNPMPESVTDRCTKAHEYIFLLTKSGKTLVWRAKDTMEWSYTPDLTETIWIIVNGERKEVSRWRGYDYWYDGDSIKEPAAPKDRKNEVYKGSPQYREGVVPGESPQSFHANGMDRWRTNSEGDPIRNKRSVWTVATQPYPEAHFAVYPTDLIRPCIRAGCPKDGVVLDPFAGAGTTAIAAYLEARRSMGIELSPEYCEMARARIERETAQLRMDLEVR